MMTFTRIRSLAACSAALVVLAGLTTSCRRDGSDDGEKEARVIVVDSKLRHNRMADLPSAVYQSQKDSPIHWQPWSEETLDLAKKAHRLLFVVIALPQQPTFLSVLDHIAETPALVASLNNEYVPVLVDGDAARELGLLTPELCAEINAPLHLPFFLWMTYEGSPVGWIPMHSQDRKGVIDLFEHSNGTISRMWQEDSDYVVTNSRIDNGHRKERMAERLRSMKFSDQPDEDVLRALRKMTTLYDSYTRSFDHLGGLFPHGVLELLGVAAQQPGIPEEIREKCGEIAQELLRDILPSPMFDPLDGGVFSARRGASWALPSFHRDCMGQARAVSALVEAWHATGDAFALERAEGVLRFAEGRYRTDDGLYAIGLEPAGEVEGWMWTLEDFKELLPAEQAEWWIRESRIKGLGNLPSEVDPRREFFRSNSLSLRKSPANYAAEAPGGAEAFLTKFEESRKILLEKRRERLPKTSLDRVPHAAATFRMVSAYASMFTVAAEEEYRKKAVDLLALARETFTDGRHLRSMKSDTADTTSHGRAFHYALALQATLDVAAITGDAAWAAWAEDLATLSAEHFASDGVLKECPDAAKILDLPISDTRMMFDDSTVGLFSLSVMRMEALNRPMVKAIEALVIPLPMDVAERPVLYADRLLASIMRHYPLRVIQGENLPEALAFGMQRLSLRGVLRGHRPAQEGVVKVEWFDGEERSAGTAEELRAVMAEIQGKTEE